MQIHDHSRFSSASIRKLIAAGYITKDNDEVLGLPPLIPVEIDDGSTGFAWGRNEELRISRDRGGLPGYGIVRDALCVHLAPGQTRVPTDNDQRKFIGTFSDVDAPLSAWTASWVMTDDNADSVIGMPILGNIAGFVLPKHVGVIIGWEALPDGGKKFHTRTDGLLASDIFEGFRIAPPRGNVWSMLSESIPIN